MTTAPSHLLPGLRASQMPVRAKLTPVSEAKTVLREQGEPDYVLDAGRCPWAGASPPGRAAGRGPSLAAFEMRSKRKHLGSESRRLSNYSKCVSAFFRTPCVRHSFSHLNTLVNETPCELRLELLQPRERNNPAPRIRESCVYRACRACTFNFHSFDKQLSVVINIPSCSVEPQRSNPHSMRRFMGRVAP